MKLLAFADNAVVGSGPGYHSPYVDASGYARLHLLLSATAGGVVAELATLLGDKTTIVPTPASATLTGTATYSVGAGTANPVGFGSRVKVVLVQVSGSPIVKYELWGEV